MLTSETKRRIDACRDVLVGKLLQPSNQVELITLALIYKFMDDLDEESVKLGGKRSFFVNGLTKYRWRNLLPQTVSADERVTLFSEGVEALGHAKKAAHLPGLFRDIFRNALLNSAKFPEGIKSRASRAVNQANISASALAGYEIPLPPLEGQRPIVLETEGCQNEISRLQSEIAANREQIRMTIDAAWNGDSGSANGAPPSQPGATPQVKGQKQNEG